MKILLTGATGYIGKRLLFLLLDGGHQVVACVRDRRRLNTEHPSLQIVEVDFLNEASLKDLPKDLDAACYLIHSMNDTTRDFAQLEETQAKNFKDIMEQTGVRQVVYLSGIVNDSSLSQHLSSRKRVEEILASGNYQLTTLRAGIILGSGSASFEIMRDLVEKLPAMIAPEWLHTRSQPIAIRNVMEFLTGVLLKQSTFGKSYDIGGPEILTYRQMLLEFGRIRGLNRWILTVPVMTPRLSSYWLFFVTRISYSLAVNLVNSMKVEVVARPNHLAEELGIHLLTFREAIERAFQKIEENDILSSWKDSFVVGRLPRPLTAYIQVPVNGCFQDCRILSVRDTMETWNRIQRIGGEQGWYRGNWLWRIRGLLDRFAGGVGLRRGRTHPYRLEAGDALDFWRVLLVDRDEGRLLLYAEMKLPGEAWLEFRLDWTRNVLKQTATFRPRGLPGRLYWYAVSPFHGYIFSGMAKKIAE